jgi:hypothetical protein
MTNERPFQKVRCGTQVGAWTAGDFYTFQMSESVFSPRRSQQSVQPPGLRIDLQQSAPDAKFVGAFSPRDNKTVLTLLMARGEAKNFTEMNYVYFDPVSVRQLALWHRGINNTWGSSSSFG